MASSLSEEEFHRMQLQLLELRTANYELDGKCKKQEREIAQSTDKYEQLEKDLLKANKAIQKSKKAKEVELLLQENDQLQRKLQSQEDEFRLQNETLMQELSTLVAANEELEKKTQQQEGLNLSDSQMSSQTEDELRRLQAKNNALQKNLHVMKDTYEKQISGLKDQMNESMLSKSEDDGDLGDGLTCGNDTADLETSNSDQAEENVDVASPDDLAQQICDLKLNLDTELEENRILKEQWSKLEITYKEKNSSLQEEFDKSTEKLKKKQESYNILQKEKEDLFHELNKKTEELQSARDRDQKYYTDQIAKLQQEVERLKSIDEESRNSSSNTITNLQSTIATLQQQVDAANIVGNQQLQEKTSKYRKQIEELQHQMSSLKQTKDDLTVQLQASKQASQETMDQLYAVQKERDTRIQEWQEINKIAEKRKSMLDELANTYQRDNASHQEKLRQVEEEHESMLKDLQEKLESERVKILDFEKLKQQFEEIKSQNQSLEEAKGWLERRLSEVEENFTKSKEESNAVIHKMEEEKETVIKNLKEEYNRDNQVLRDEYEEKLKLCCDIEESLKQEIETHSQEITRLKQEVKDGVDSKKIHEKKGMTMLKDLKRQLHQERKRAEKLQDKLQEVLSDSKNNKSMDELFTSFDSRNDSLREDISSVSSWSAGASLVRDMSGGSGPHSPDRLQSPSSDYEQEHNDLVNRVASIQQQKWDLEEKVSHLEQSTAAMANDLLDKTKIIEHYVMESRSDPKPHHSSHSDDKLSFKKVLDLVNKSEDHSLKEMNRKLQRMLEETLTKNMHLQKDLEVLSQEIVRLSQAQHVSDVCEKDQPISNQGQEQGETTTAS